MFRREGCTDVQLGWMMPGGGVVVVVVVVVVKEAVAVALGQE